MLRGMILVLLALVGSGNLFPPQSIAAEGDDLMVLAADHYAASRWELAAASFQALLQKHPESVHQSDAIFYRAECLLQLGRFPEAGHLYQKFQDEFADDSRHALASFRTGEAAYLAGRYPQAIAQFEPFLATSPSGPNQLLAKVYFAGALLAVAERQALQPDQATGDDSPQDEPSLERASQLFESVVDEAGEEKFVATCQFGLARCLDLQDKPLLAGASYQKLLDNPQPAIAAQAHYYLGRLAVEEGEPLRAATTWEALIEKWPESAWAREVYGPSTEAHLQAGKIDQARAALARWRGASEDGPSAAQLRHLARLAREEEETDWSLELYAQLANEDKNTTPAAVQRLAAAQVEAGQLEAAAQTLKILLAGKKQPPALAVATLQLAEIYEQLEKLQQSLATYLQVAERWPETPAAAIALRHAATLVIDKKDFQRAAEIYQQLLSMDLEAGERAEVIYRRGWALRDAQKTDEASEAFATLNRDYRDSTYWSDATYRLAEYRFVQGNREQAAALLTQLLKKEGQGELAPHALYLSGRVAVDAGQWTDARQPFSQLVEQFPDSTLAPSAAYWRAEATYQSGDYPQAADYFQKLTDTSLPTERAAQIALRQAQLHARAGEWQSARDAIAPLLTEKSLIVPEDELYYLLGRCRMAAADLAGARVAFLRAAQRDQAEKTETSAMAQWMIGETLMHQERYAEAAAEYFRVVSLYPHPRWQAAALLQAGHCYERRSQVRDAEKLYRQILENYPESEFVTPARKQLKAITSGRGGPRS